MSFMISVAHQVLFGSLNQGNEMSGACGKHGGKMKLIKGLVKNPEGKRNLENLGMDGRITLIFILSKNEGMTKPGQEQVAERRNMVMNLRVP
jgi:hypothetical protein